MPERTPNFEQIIPRESNEIIELRREFAQEIKKPHNGSYLKKLRRIAGAFALAGVTVFPPQKATAPELSEEFLAAGKAKNLHQIYQNERIDLYKKVLDSLKERGGVPASHEAPGKIIKVLPDDTLSIGETLAREGQIPHFSKPEVILGEEFIKEQPEKAKEYMEKIEKTMAATVLIRGDGGNLGSGVVINTQKGEAILTSEHVTRFNSAFSVELFDGRHGIAKLIYQEYGRDLAVINLPGN